MNQWVGDGLPSSVWLKEAAQQGDDARRAKKRQLESEGSKYAVKDRDNTDTRRKKQNAISAISSNARKQGHVQALEILLSLAEGHRVHMGEQANLLKMKISALERQSKIVRAHPEPRVRPPATLSLVEEAQKKADLARKEKQQELESTGLYILSPEDCPRTRRKKQNMVSSLASRARRQMYTHSLEALLKSSEERRATLKKESGNLREEIRALERDALELGFECESTLPEPVVSLTPQQLNELAPSENVAEKSCLAGKQAVAEAGWIAEATRKLKQRQLETSGPYVLKETESAAARKKKQNMVSAMASRARNEKYESTLIDMLTHAEEKSALAAKEIRDLSEILVSLEHAHPRNPPPSFTP
eukprot:CAMPEP_0185849868 /NCGR_PEP_ID=MMETSP1354-20130828/4222_1 /TAXON_ID=708628 /ORGANISM="Erythrolobus madagascarensis, Strain CCMP3276" /LENGTH=360 /DNA_ID=CAMNT_0028550471 /DNA_START=104 /DNA_END=1186 /DNA_ORIENTATION=+